jgi:hypothetical protein
LATDDGIENVPAWSMARGIAYDIHRMGRISAWPFYGSPCLFQAVKNMLEGPGVGAAKARYEDSQRYIFIRSRSGAMAWHKIISK